MIAASFKSLQDGENILSFKKRGTEAMLISHLPSSKNRSLILLKGINIYRKEYKVNYVIFKKKKMSIIIILVYNK